MKSPKDKRKLFQSLRMKGKVTKGEKEAGQSMAQETDSDAKSPPKPLNKNIEAVDGGMSSGVLGNSPDNSNRSAIALSSRSRDRYSLFRRKGKVIKSKREMGQQIDSPTETDSPTQVGNLVTQSSESVSPKGSPEVLKLVHSSNVVVDDIQDSIDRDDQRIIALNDPLPSLPTRSSDTSKALLRFMNSTSQMMTDLETEVGQKLDSCSRKIDNLDHRIGLMRSKRRLELVTNIRRDVEEEDSSSSIK